MSRDRAGHKYHNLVFLRPLGYSKITMKMMTLNNIRYIFVAVTSFFLLVLPPPKRAAATLHTENSHQYHRRTIIGGSNASSGRYSYFACLRAVFNGETGGHFCGGAVIAPKVILTAAHCAGGKYAEYVTFIFPSFGSTNQREQGIKKVQEEEK